MKLIKLLLLALITNFGMQAQELVVGQATLTKLQKGVYEIKKNDGTVKTIDIRPNAEEHIQGTLSVLFNDCEKTRQSVFNLTEITERALVKTVTEYNNCDYTPFKPTDKEIKKAADFKGDQFKLFGSVGASVNRISFFQLDEFENLTQVQLSFGLAATPGFLGSLQGKLHFTMEVSAAFSGDKDFSNSTSKTNFNKNTYRWNLGAEYHFNKNGTIHPIVGIAAGLARDQYKGNFSTYKIDRTKGSAFWTPKIGLLYDLDEKKSLGVIVSYIPEYENDLSFINNDEVIPFVVNTHFVNAGLFFYF